MRRLQWRHPKTNIRPRRASTRRRRSASPSRHRMSQNRRRMRRRHSSSGRPCLLSAMRPRCRATCRRHRGLRHIPCRRTSSNSSRMRRILRALSRNTRRCRLRSRTRNHLRCMRLRLRNTWRKRRCRMRHLLPRRICRRPRRTRRRRQCRPTPLRRRTRRRPATRSKTGVPGNRAEDDVANRADHARFGAGRSPADTPSGRASVVPHPKPSLRSRLPWQVGLGLIPTRTDVDFPGIPNRCRFRFDAHSG